MNRLPAAFAAFTAATALAYASDKEDTVVVVASLEPDGIHEECVTLAAGEKRSWYWKSSAPVDFNIHYHRGDEVFYPLKRERMRGDGGTFTAKTGEGYCWMWSAKAAAKIEGRISVK
jgi:hypothetical protein